MNKESEMCELKVTEQELVDLDNKLDPFGSGVYETEFGKFAILGIRVQEEEFALGSIDHRSINDPDDQEPEPLDGICTYGIGMYAGTASEAIHNASDFGLPHAAIIAGNDYDDVNVNDEGEVIIKDPVVIKIIQ